MRLSIGRPSWDGWVRGQIVYPGTGVRCRLTRRRRSINSSRYISFSLETRTNPRSASALRDVQAELAHLEVVKLATSTHNRARRSSFSRVIASSITSCGGRAKDTPFRDGIECPLVLPVTIGDEPSAPACAVLRTEISLVNLLT